MSKKNENNDEYHSYLFEDLSTDELKNKIVRLLKEIKGLEAEKKDYVSGIKDTIKEYSAQIDSAVHWIGVKETEAEKKALADQVSQLGADGE